MQFTKQVVLELIVHSAGVDETIEQVFDANVNYEAEVLNVVENQCTIQFEDGSVAYNVPVQYCVF
jgi:hypothetical protein